jgi:hypothetical protein
MESVALIVFRGSAMANPTLINLAAVCIIIATAYGAAKEVVGYYQTQQAQTEASIARGKAIIDQTLGR